MTCWSKSILFICVATVSDVMCCEGAFTGIDIRRFVSGESTVSGFSVASSVCGSSDSAIGGGTLERQISGSSTSSTRSAKEMRRFKSLTNNIVFAVARGAHCIPQIDCYIEQLRDFGATLKDINDSRKESLLTLASDQETFEFLLSRGLLNSPEAEKIRASLPKFHILQADREVPGVRFFDSIQLDNLSTVIVDVDDVSYEDFFNLMMDEGLWGDDILEYADSVFILQDDFYAHGYYIQSCYNMLSFLLNLKSHGGWRKISPSEKSKFYSHYQDEIIRYLGAESCHIDFDKLGKMVIVTRNESPESEVLKNTNPYLFSKFTNFQSETYNDLIFIDMNVFYEDAQQLIAQEILNKIEGVQKEHLCLPSVIALNIQILKNRMIDEIERINIKNTNTLMTDE